ncbi:MAG: hypothetical protein WBP11_08245 [Dokdonella sp.]
MKSNNKTFAAITVLAVALALGACGKKEEPMPEPMAPAPAPMPAPEATPPAAPAPAVTLTSVTLGNAVDASNAVTTPTETFGSKDTIYASVATNGSSASTPITAKWMYQDGQMVNESTQTIAPTGPAVTAFHIAKPDGWPLGGYTVEISMDGSVVDTKKFTVQ